MQNFQSGHIPSCNLKAFPFFFAVLRSCLSKTDTFYKLYLKEHIKVNFLKAQSPILVAEYLATLNTEEGSSLPWVTVTNGLQLENQGCN